MGHGHLPAVKAFFSSRELFEDILCVCAQGLIVVNLEGIIVYVGKGFDLIFGMEGHRALGRHVTQVVENTRLHIVAKTGVAEIDQIQIIGQKAYVVSRIPIMVKDRCRGIAGKISLHGSAQLRALSCALEQAGDTPGEARASESGPQNPFQTMHAFFQTSETIRQEAAKAAESKAGVLIFGETGVGKALLARAIHQMSDRGGSPFVMLNCSAVHENRFEAELFGEGDQGTSGKLKAAGNGTLFLSEVGDMPLSAQARLFQVIQETSPARSEGSRNLHVRIMASTSRNLNRMVGQGRFRKDLFYRLNVIPIHIPPLRRRKADLLHLIRVLWGQLGYTYDRPQKHLDPQAFDALGHYEWPGNVQELENILERLMALVSRPVITQAHVRTAIWGQGSGGADVEAGHTLGSLVARTEKKAISQALVFSNANRSKAAKRLGISRALLYKKMHAYGLMPPLHGKETIIQGTCGASVSQPRQGRHTQVS